MQGLAVFKQRQSQNRAITIALVSCSLHRTQHNSDGCTHLTRSGYNGDDLMGQTQHWIAHYGMGKLRPDFL